MATTRRLDAVIVGSGPNGLAAAITLARAGRSVLVLERSRAAGGGARSAELTRPGFVHDVCSAIHPLFPASPFFRELRLEDDGLRWLEPEIAIAHPLDDGRAALVKRSFEATAATLGSDGPAYVRLVHPFVAHAEQLFAEILRPLRFPSHPLNMLRLAWRGLRSARGLAASSFREDPAGGLFAGMAAHAIRPLEEPLTAAVGLMFCVSAHAFGWPLPIGGSQQITDALLRRLHRLGGEILTDSPVNSLRDIPPARAILFDVSPRQLSRIAGESLPSNYRRTLERFRHGPGIFKVDWCLRGPIPWNADGCRRAGTVHVGGTLDEIAGWERAVWKAIRRDERVDSVVDWKGTMAAAPGPGKRPFVIVAQQSLFDQSRAPAGYQTGWAYCHVPSGCTEDLTVPVESQIERFAPGFRDLILDRHSMTAGDFESYNPNYIGGDITGGVMDLRQMAGRPALRWSPYATPAKNIFLCSASTPPGPGVHGMCGYYAAQAALNTVLSNR